MACQRSCSCSCSCLQILSLRSDLGQNAEEVPTVPMLAPAPDAAQADEDSSRDDGDSGSDIYFSATSTADPKPTPTNEAPGRGGAGSGPAYDAARAARHNPSNWTRHDDELNDTQRQLQLLKSKMGLN